MNVRSISFRLVARYAGLLVGIFILLGALWYLDLRHFLLSDLRESQLRRAHRIGDALLIHVKDTGEASIGPQIHEWFDPEGNDRLIRITRVDGSLVYQSPAPRDGSFDPAAVPRLDSAPESDSFRKVELPGPHALQVVAINYKSAGNPDYLIEFGQLLDPVETMLNHLFLQLVLGMPLAIVIIAGGGYLLVRRALTPVEQITRAAEQITQHNLSERLPVANTGDEIERLSVSLNRMIGRLDDAFQNSKRFVADASHELRTPLTVLRGELEGLAEDSRVGSEWRERAASLLEEAIYLSKVVEQLFTLSRLDAGEAQSEWTRFDLSELARTTADQMGLLAEDKEIKIKFSASEPTMVEGDRVRLKQVVVNLLDNAIKYTPSAGAIELRVFKTNGHAMLEVADNGIGIPEAALIHVFDRFYRVDQSRGNGSESAGLGLSIVKSICSAHGAQVEAQSTVGKGSRFRVKISLSKD